MSICQDADLSFCFPGMAADLGAAYTLGGHVAERRAAAHAALEAEHCNEKQWCFRALCLSRPWARPSCWLDTPRRRSQPRRAQALDLARQHQKRKDQACALHQLGTLLPAAPPPDIAQAQAHYQQALALAEEIGMRPLQAHCHHGLGTLYAQTGQREQARAALSSAIELYRCHGHDLLAAPGRDRAGAGALRHRRRDVEL